MSAMLIMLVIISINVNVVLVGYIIFNKTIEKRMASLEDTNKKLLMRLSQPVENKPQRPVNRQSMASPLVTMGATEEELLKFKKLENEDKLYTPSVPRKSMREGEKDVR